MMADGRSRMADGRWRMADGGWRMADGGSRIELQIADGSHSVQRSEDGGWPSTVNTQFVPHIYAVWYGQNEVPALYGIRYFILLFEQKCVEEILLRFTCPCGGLHDPRSIV